jgi:hypothetical protein
MTFDELRARIDALDLGYRDIAESEGPLWEKPGWTLRCETQRRVRSLGLHEKYEALIWYLYNGQMGRSFADADEAARALSPLIGVPVETILWAYEEAVVVPWYQESYTGEVYLAQTPDGLVKIGLSADAEDRVRQMRSKYRGIQLLHIIETNVTIFLEHLLHRRFSEYHVRTEWFRLPDAEIETMRQVGYVELQPRTIH